MLTSTQNKPQAGTKPPLTIRARAEQARARAQSAHQRGVAAHQHVKGVQKQVAPFVGMVLLVLASAALNAAREATAADAEILGGTAAVCVVVAVVAAKQMRRRLDDRKSLARGYAFLGVASAWLMSTATFGLTLNAVAILAALGTALSLHYLRKNRIPDRAPAVPAPTPAAAVPVYAERWAANIGIPGGTLPGTKLTDWTEIPAGDRYTVHLVPGRQNYATVLGVLENLRTGLGLRQEHDIIVERHPVLDAAFLQLTIVTRSPVQTSKLWPGPDAFNPATGRVALGPFTDGEGAATWKAYTDNRLWGGYLCGGTGSGKSRMIESIAFSLAASETHPTVIFYGDGQGGSSSPLLVKSADNAAITHEAILGMLLGMYLVMKNRQDENLVNDWEGFTPTLDRPGVLGIFDEIQKFLSKIENPIDAEQCQYLVATIAREGGKVGVALIGASQESTLGAFGGAGNLAEMIRSNLLMGNGIILRSKDANAKQVFGVDVVPKDFPELAGYAYCVDREPGGRSAPFRGFHLTNELAKLWPSKIRWKSLDVTSANAYGPDYHRRRDVVAAAKDAARARIQARRSGQPVADDLTSRAFAAAGAPEGSDGAAALDDLPEVARFPVWNPNTGKVQARPMHDGHLKVIDALKADVVSPTPIAKVVGKSVRRVHQLLDELMDEFGAVERDTHGEYRLVNATEGSR